MKKKKYKHSFPLLFGEINKRLERIEKLKKAKTPKEILALL